MKDLLLVTVECWRWDRRKVIRPDGFDVTEGITPGHYTRPALAGLLTGSVTSAAAAAVRDRTIAATLHDHGYTTIAHSHSPQTLPAFNFDRGFDTASLHESDGRAMGRGSAWRERLAELQTVRRIHRRVTPKHATLGTVQRDTDTVDEAIADWQSADSPRFMWVHLMGSHRPYGWGEDVLEPTVSRRAASATPQSRLTPDAQALRGDVTAAYEDSLRRVSDCVSRLVGAVSDDTGVVICGDHGEELGEEGYFFHGGYRRRIVDALVTVPVLSRGVDIHGERMGLEDVPGLLCSEIGIPNRQAWVRPQQRRGWLTVAPWGDTASVRYSTRDSKLVFADADRGTIQNRANASRDVKQQLQALGYADVG